MSLGLPFVVGIDFFPPVDAGLMKLHFRAPSGTRIEETERLVLAVEQHIRTIIPADELSTLNDMIGMPLSYNLAFVQTDNIGGMDAEILIALKPGAPPDRGLHAADSRGAAAATSPASTLYFQPADIVSQVLNFGLSAPIDVQIEANDLDQAYEVAPPARREHAPAFLASPTCASRRCSTTRRSSSTSTRDEAARVGLTQRDVANDLLTSLSSEHAGGAFVLA